MKQVKSRALAGLAAVALAGGIIAGVGPSVSAATTACGSGCVALAAQKFTTGDVSAVSGSGAAQGQKVILAAAGQNSTEDFKLSDLGPVSEFYAVGIVGSAVGLTWPNNEAFEYQYAPGGTDSGFCLGTATTAANGTAVTLQPCGVTAQTLWITLSIDTINGVKPLINGSDTLVNTPYVLTATTVGGNLTTHTLNLVDGTFNPAQMWQNLTGVL
jgi:hypothetical protein